MMAAVRTWLMGVVLTAFAVSLARQLTPGQREKRLVAFAGGLLLLLALFRPLACLDMSETAIPAFGSQEATEELRRQQTQALAAIIAERTGAYISDKSRELGGAVDARVETAAGESGIPLPWAVELWGEFDPRLRDWIARELAIPFHRQNWLEGEKWTENRES